MMGHLFSILITTYNRPDIVGRAIQSCLSQTCTDFEIIVCDDGSSLDYSTVLSRFVDPRVRYVKTKRNGGKIAALIQGRALARGNFVAFLDDDDEWKADHLANMAKAIAATGDEASSTLFFSQIEIIYGEDDTKVRPYKGKAPTERFLDYIIRYRGLIQNSGICLSRELFNKFLLDQSIRKHVDYEICQLAECAGAKFFFSAGRQRNLALRSRRATAQQGQD